MLLWHKYLESLSKNNVFIHFFQLTMKEEHTKGLSHNNPEEATTYVRSVNSLTDSFDMSICGFDRYLRLDAWQTFIHALSQLLLKLDSAYFTKLDPDVILDTIPDKALTFFLHALRKQQSEYSNVFPVTKFQMVLKLCPKCAYKIYHVSIEKDNKLSPDYLAIFAMPTTTWQK